MSARDLAALWASEAPPGTDVYSSLRKLIALLTRELYSHFNPSSGLPSFDDRLTQWLHSASTKTQRQAMYELIPWLVFAASHEMDALMSAAFGGPVCHWLIETADLQLDSVNLDNSVRSLLTRTYFCSLAGYNIEGFCRYTAVPSRDTTGNLRQWTLEAQSSSGAHASKRAMLDQGNFEYLVVIEDFVGSGTQLLQAEATIAALTNVKILICPLCCAPQGAANGYDLASRRSGHVSFRPLFILPETALITERPTRNEPQIHKRIRKVIREVAGTMPEITNVFGFQGNTPGSGAGSLFLMHTNCPDNVPAMVWHESDNKNWKPLFPRQHRGV